eukprot:SAG31_NODE_11534_length_1020_cov_0.890337_1_plen_87_part_00
MHNMEDQIRRAELESVMHGMGEGGTTFRAQTCINTLRLPPAANFTGIGAEISRVAALRVVFSACCFADHYRSMLQLSISHNSIDKA